MSHLLLFSIAWLFVSAPLPARDLVLEHATLVDLDRLGTSGRDVHDAVVVVRDGHVVAAGAPRRVAVPAGARHVDLRGKWIIVSRYRHPSESWGPSLNLPATAREQEMDASVRRHDAVSG